MPDNATPHNAAMCACGHSIDEHDEYGCLNANCRSICGRDIPNKGKKPYIKRVAA